MDKKTREMIDVFRRDPQKVHFDDLMWVCTKLFGQPRQKGSHLIFKTGMPHPDALVTIQRLGKEAKSYQIKQFLKIVKAKFEPDDG